MKRDGLRAAAVCLLVVASLVAGLPSSGADSHRVVTQPRQVLATAVHPFAAENATVVSQQVPLLEIFTATWCPPCAPADRAIERLLAEAANSSDAPQLAALAYHPFPDPGTEDPFGVPEGMARMQRKYGATWFPSVYVGGILRQESDFGDISVAEGMEQAMYSGYGRLLNEAGDLAPTFVAALSSSLDGRNATAGLTLRATAHVWEGLFVQAVLWEDDVFFPGSNGVDDHRYVVRGVLSREKLGSGVAPGDESVHEWRFVVPEEVDLEDAGVTVFVEVAWGERGPDEADRLMAFAGGVAAVAAIAVGVIARLSGPRGGNRP